MVRRFLAGFNPGFGTMGIWLSMPGVDVVSGAAGGAGNYILKTDLKFEQIVMSGVVGLSPGQTQTVLLPADLVKRPYVALAPCQSSNPQYPHDLGLVGSTGQIEIIAGVAIYGSQLTFYNNNSTYALYTTFMVFNRSIGV
jgi:hypothetical protein